MSLGQAARGKVRELQGWGVRKEELLAETTKHIDPAELEQAFALFNQVSEQLTGAYQELQQRVEQLTHELAVANGELRRQLQEKEALTQRLALLLDALPAAVLVLDETGRVMEYNPPAEHMLGEPLVGQGWQALTRRCLRATATPQEWELDAPPGQIPAVRRVSLDSSALDSAGRRIMLLHDITEAHALQQQLERHQRLSSMGEMAAGLAHQLRTPLATALLYTANLTKPDLPEPERIRFAEKSLARLRHLEQLVQDMLSFVRGERGGQEVIQVEAFCTELYQVMEPQMAQKNIAFTLSDDSMGATVAGNRKALTGALLNLLENAMQACAQEDHVVLSACLDGGSVVLSVSDTGRGIDATTQQRLFEPFFTTRAEGTGLGLAIVREVAHAHGGDVRVESGSGSGSVFRLSLPRLTQAGVSDETLAVRQER